MKIIKIEKSDDNLYKIINKATNEIFDIVKNNNGTDIITNAQLGAMFMDVQNFKQNLEPEHDNVFLSGEIDDIKIKIDTNMKFDDMRIYVYNNEELKETIKIETSLMLI